jgi:integrin beta 3
MKDTRTMKRSSDTGEEALKGNNDTGYRGKQTKSRTGKNCTNWADSVTHTTKIYPDAGLVKNFCRNPAPDEDAKTIWCFIEGGTPLHFWEYCDPLTGRNEEGGKVEETVTINSNTGSTTTGGGVAPNTKLQLSKCQQASPYGNNSYPCTNAFSGGSKFTHTNKGVGMWWRAQFGQEYWIDRVRILNRKDCCGGRLAGTEVFVGGEKCGKVESGTRNGQWYTVKCQNDLKGSQITLKTTRNEYLSISGIEVWTGEEVDEEETTVYNVAANTKVGFNASTARQSTNYSNSNYLASYAFMGPNKFTHTKNGVGQWWEVGFNQGYWVDRIRVRNRKDCCGSRLNKTRVLIGDQECGSVNGGSNGAWYTVKCSKPLFGNKVRLVTVQNTYLSISGIEVWTAAA